MLRPLEQFYCDACGELILEPRQGMLHWYVTMDPARQRVCRGFRIVHIANASPHWPGGSCYYDPRKYHVNDLNLPDCLGVDGLVLAFSMLDVGPYHKRTYEGPEAPDLREFTELMRRLFIPYYEEARHYWAQAIADGLFEDANELYVYAPSMSRAIIERYGSKPSQVA